MDDKKKKDIEKRGAKGGGTVRQRSDGRWEGRCTINGKRRSFYGDKQADVLKAMREAQTAKDNGTYCDPKRITFGEWLDIWLEVYLEPRVKHSTYTRNVSIIKSIKPTLGAIKLQALNTSQIQAFYNKIINEKKLSNYALKTGIHATISNALNQAVKLKYLAFNPVQNCVLPRIIKKELTPFTEKEIFAFLQRIEKGEPLKNLFIVALFTGMRHGELLGLPWDAVDFVKGTITIKQQLQSRSGSESKFYIDTPKNGKARTIFPPPIVMQVLKVTRREQIEAQLRAGAVWDNELNLVFTNQVGRHLSHDTVLYHFKKVVKDIGRPDMRFHDLRHTYAVMALQAGNDPKTVQNTLGHHTAAFTLDVYAHVTEDMNRKSAEKMQDYYDKLNA